MRWMVVLLVLGVGPLAHASPWQMLPAKAVVARVTAESDLSRHRVMQPFSMAPDLLVGLDGSRTLAWHHSRAFDARLGAGNGVCIVGSRETLGDAPPTCASYYAGSGLSLLQRVTRRIVGRIGTVLVDTSPLKLAITGGAIVQLASGRWWTIAAPTLVAGVTNRELGNRDRVQLPIYAGVRLHTGEVHVRTGIDATVQTWNDTFAIPVGVGGSVAMFRRLRIGADLTFDRAFGRLNAMSWRSSLVFAEMRFGALR